MGRYILNLAIKCSLVVLAIGFVSSLFVVPQEVLAAKVIVEPLIIDHQGLPRDIIKGSFKITNPNPYKTTIFTVTKNFDPTTGEQNFIEPSEADLGNSLANWISVATKMIEMEPNETKTIDYDININLKAEEGAYHAIMFFPEGSSRSEVEQLINSAPKMTVNVTVGDDSKERLQVAKFHGSGLVLGFNANFDVTVNNTGNKALKPEGEVRIYNRNGEEVATLVLNSDKSEVQPGESKVFETNWSKARGFGRYKAQIVLEFGDKQFQTYQDSMYFYLLPWPILLCLIMILCGVVLLLVYTLHRAHTQKLRQQEEYFQMVMKQKVSQAKRAAIKKATATTTSKSKSKTDNQNTE